MLIVTGVLLTAVLAIMVGKTARTLQGVGWLPITPVDLDVPYWMGLWLGVFPTVETLLAQVVSVVFVVGSYLVAERVKKRGRSAARSVQPGAPGRAATDGLLGREAVGSGRGNLPSVLD
jgi:high-affinity iron transporter